MLFQSLQKQTVDLLGEAAQQYPLSSRSTNADVPTPTNRSNSSDMAVPDVTQLLHIYTTVYDKEAEAAKAGQEEKDGRVASLIKCTAKRKALQAELEKCEESFKELSDNYNSVAEKTSSLHNACDQMMSQQTQLASATERISANLHYYQQYEWLVKKLQTPKLSLTGTLFTQILSTIHECMAYLKVHEEQKEAGEYLRRYEQCLSRALTAIKVGVLSDLEACKEDVLYRQGKMQQPQPTAPTNVDDDTFALLYGLFGVKATSIHNTITQAHQFFADTAEYQSVLLEMEHEYFQLREKLLRPIVTATIDNLCQRHAHSSCTLTRDGCVFLLRLCDDEFRLYRQFFVVGGGGADTEAPTPRAPIASTRGDVQHYFWQQISFEAFIEGLCRILYDTLRPLIIHNPHLETLAQLCTLLKVEMIEERCGILFSRTASAASTIASTTAAAPINPRAGFARVMSELVGDIVERIVYRTSLFCQSDILSYNPAPGDLAYPERLQMMKDIGGGGGGGGSVPTSKKTSSSSSSAIDLHCLWYPTVRRAVMCLSKLYKCLDAVFVSISRELLEACCQSLEVAAERIRQLPIDPVKASLKGSGRGLDAELFIVKHLLILREQTFPYRITTTSSKGGGGRTATTSIGGGGSVTGSVAHSVRGDPSGYAPAPAYSEAYAAQYDYSLDFGRYKDSVFKLLSQENRGRWFELSTNNAFLSFLLAAPVYVSELQMDSRRIIETQLRRYCHHLIGFVVNGALIGPLVQLSKHIEEAKREGQQQLNIATAISTHPHLNPKALADCVGEAFKRLRQNWPAVRAAFSLYIGLRETEEILLHPIRKNVVGLFTSVSLFTENNYTEEQRQIAQVPSQEQIWMLLNA